MVLTVLMSLQVSEPGSRARIVFNLKRDDATQPWRLATLEQHVERRTGDYDGGTSLEACGWGLPISCLPADFLLVSLLVLQADTQCLIS